MPKKQSGEPNQPCTIEDVHQAMANALKLCMEAIDCIGAVGETPPHYADMANTKLLKAYTAAKKALEP